LALPDHNQSIFLFATMEVEPAKACNQNDATTFICLIVLRLRVNSTVVVNSSQTFATR